MSELEWREPPDDARNHDPQWCDGIIAQLKTRPGVWARVLTGARNPYWSDPFVNLGCEAAQSRVNINPIIPDDLRAPGVYDIYLRWPVTA